jgi:hypothetical protein
MELNNLNETNDNIINKKKTFKKGKKKTLKTLNIIENETTDLSTKDAIAINLNKEKPKIILTIDVGLKNLAMCIMDNNCQIYLWNVYNMLDNDDCELHSCCEMTKDGKQCDKKVQFHYPKENKITNETVMSYCCKKHFPKDMRVNEKKYFMKIKKVNDYLLQDIAERIMKTINSIYDDNIEIFNMITNICIELQPKVNQRMKFTSHIIYAKFVDLYKYKNIPIRFIRASQNLQAYKGPVIECKLKTPYAKRKFLSVAYVKWYLEFDKLNNEHNKDKKWMEFLLNHNKKDDLCDVVNANLNVHAGLSKHQKRNKNGSEIK